ncbi:LapA family protein [Nostoc sp. UHCC 0702]|nr:LapA family protein [Nostoc sp. UHCC 0702]
MAVIRLILLVAVLGGLTLLLVQNWSPVLSLVFLGMRTQPLPLAMWILFSTTAGALTSVLISTLFKLSSYFVKPQRQTRFRSTAASPRTKATRPEEPTPRPASPPPPASKTEYASDEEFDDWETNRSNDDWNFDENSTDTPTSSPKTQPSRDSQTYERQQEPKSSSQSGSVYSYSYREPKNTAVGKAESVYDADYRVIIPPYQPPPTNQADNANDDDWGFFDDDDFEDGDKRSRK